MQHDVMAKTAAIKRPLLQRLHCLRTRRGEYFTLSQTTPQRRLGDKTRCKRPTYLIFTGMIYEPGQKQNKM